VLPNAVWQYNSATYYTSTQYGVACASRFGLLLSDFFLLVLTVLFAQVAEDEFAELPMSSSHYGGVQGKLASLMT